MLVLDEQLEVKSVTLFRDNTATGTFHYLPAAPQVVIENGQVRAQLIRFRAMGKNGRISIAGAERKAKRLGFLWSRYSVMPRIVPPKSSRAASPVVLSSFSGRSLGVPSRHGGSGEVRNMSHRSHGHVARPALQVLVG